MNAVAEGINTMDVVALGELLIDFTYAGISENGQRLFEQNPGGAPANFLTTISHMGLKTALIGKVGNDMHGKVLVDTLKKENIDTNSIIVDDDFFTTLAFVAINADGEREFSFARKPGADTKICKDELNREIIENTKIFHIGSLSLTDSPAKEATYAAIEIAKKAKKIISYDPNYRASLWSDEKTAIKEMTAVLELSDMVKISDAESAMLTGYFGFEKAADAVLEKGPSLVAITLGENGVYVKNESCGVIIPAIKTKAVDTTGAGDSFWGGFISRFLESGKKLDELNENDLSDFARFGNAVAGLCIEKRGGIPAIPTREAVCKKVKS